MRSSGRVDARRTRHHLARLTGGVAVLAAVYLAAIALAGLSARPRPADLAVVFGNAVTADGQPSPRLRARLDTALALYRHGFVPRVLVSGGLEDHGTRDEARVMADYLARNGIPSAAIIEDPAGDDTFLTARHAAALLRPGAGAIAVTQWFHVPRAMLAMRRFGVRRVSGAWPRFAERRDVFSFLREAVAIPVYAIRGAGGGRGAPDGLRPGEAAAPRRS